jgi:hypothetical protein
MASMAFLMPLLLQASSPATPAPTLVAASEAATTAPLPSKADKLICKRRQKTGSLAGYERSCHTKAEWQKISDSTREVWQEMQGSKGSTHGG